MCKKKTKKTLYYNLKFKDVNILFNNLTIDLGFSQDKLNKV
jgi:hypothetical protein